MNMEIMMLNKLIFLMMIMFMIFMIFPLSFNSNPLFLGMKLFMFNILNSMILIFYYKNNWYSFLLFLIIIGGLMIMFLYFTSFIMNLKIMLNKFELIQIKFMLLMFIIMLMLMLNFKYFNLLYMNKLECLFMENFNLLINMNFNLLFNDKMLTLMFIYNNPMNLISLFLMLYLFFTLTTIVKISFYKKKMIRKMN